MTPQPRGFCIPLQVDFRPYGLRGWQCSVTGGGGRALPIHEPIPARPITSSECIRKGGGGGGRSGGGGGSCHVFPCLRRVALPLLVEYFLDETPIATCRVGTLVRGVPTALNRTYCRRFLREWCCRGRGGGVVVRS